MGAAVWAAVAYFANVEIGYIAWGIGALVGIAVAAAGKNTPLAGVAAVLITVASLLIGKFAVVEISIHDRQDEIDEVAAQWVNPDAEITDEDLLSYLSSQIVKQREAAGEQIAWPDVTDEEAGPEAFVPADIWQEATKQLSEKQ